MATYYEWTVETLDEYGDIQDVAFWDNLNEIPDLNLNNPAFDYGLLKRIGNQDDGEKHRAYAYIRDGKLETEFDDGSKVPDKFHQELSKFLNKQ